MCGIQNMMGGFHGAGVSVKDPLMDIDWRYEFSAPKYHDFTCEETLADVLAAERWFDIAIPYENSRRCSCSTAFYPDNMIDIWDVIDRIFSLGSRKKLKA